MSHDEMKNKSRGFSIDMSGEAIGKRIDKVSQLRELGLALRKAKIIGPVTGSEEPTHPPAQEKDSPTPN